jgi:hypothetical protein
MDKVVLCNDEIELALIPEFGARVVALIDRQTGRDWIAARPAKGSPEGDAVFGGDSATGWDECFPTVASCTLPDGRRLRDHGDLWGRAWIVSDLSERAVTTSFENQSFRFTRSLSLDGPAVSCLYLVENLQEEKFDYLWAMHLLLAVSESDHIELPEGVAFQFTFRSDAGSLQAGFWPGAGTFALNNVQPASARYAAKLQFDEATAGGTRIGDETGSLRVSGSGPFASSLGLWLCYGGWPAAFGVHQIAIEPTSAPADDLLAARKMARSVSVPARGNVAWQTRLEVEPPLGLSASWSPGERSVKPSRQVQ